MNRLDQMIAIVECLKEHGAMNVTDIALKTGEDYYSVLPVLKWLAKEEFVSMTRGRKSYTISLAVKRFAHLALAAGGRTKGTQS